MEDLIEIWDNKDGTVQAAFVCPGCGEYHAPRIKGTSNVWGFNNSKTKPTFTPSILVRWTSIPENPEMNEKGEYILDGNGKIKGAKNEICHSFVTDGKIRFLNDCTHDKKGQTIELNSIKTT